MATDRHQTATFPTDKTLSQGQVDDGVHVVFAGSVLRDTHPPNEDRTRRFGHHPRKFPHSVLVNAAVAFQFFPRGLFKRVPKSLEARSAITNKLLVQPPLTDHVL